MAEPPVVYTAPRWIFTDDARQRLAALLDAAPSDAAWYDLRRRAEQLALTPSFDRMIALEHNIVDP